MWQALHVVKTYCAPKGLLAGREGGNRHKVVDTEARGQSGNHHRTEVKIIQLELGQQWGMETAAWI